MELKERIQAVEVRLREMQGDERQAGQAGPPCVRCIHYIPERTMHPPSPALCGHLVNTQRVYDSTRGDFVEVNSVTPAQSRGHDGLCGFEGILFEKNKLGWPSLAEMGSAAYGFGLKGFALLGIAGVAEIFGRAFFY